MKKLLLILAAALLLAPACTKSNTFTGSSWEYPGDFGTVVLSFISSSNAQLYVSTSNGVKDDISGSYSVSGGEAVFDSGRFYFREDSSGSKLATWKWELEKARREGDLLYVLATFISEIHEGSKYGPVVETNRIVTRELIFTKH